MHKKAEKKLRSLFSGELTAAIAFVLLWIMYLRTFEWAKPYLVSFPSVYAFVLLELILLQGSLYWFLKLKQVKRKDYSTLPSSYLKIFKLFKGLNLFLIGIGTFVMIYQLITKPFGIFFFIILYLFAIIEHVNYYHIRLSYLSVDEIKELIRQKGFRSSKLAKELKTL